MSTDPQETPGKLVVISGPSGVGKGTVIKRVLDVFPDRLTLSISATTRSPRVGEREGIDYHFLDPETFHRLRQGGKFLECCEVFGRGHWYGTLVDEVRPSLKAGKWVLLEIDVQGTESVLEHFPDAVTVFLRPSSSQLDESMAELERRLRGRKTEAEDAVQRRLEIARQELESAEDYQFQVVNDTVEQAVNEICDILRRSGGSWA